MGQANSDEWVDKIIQQLRVAVPQPIVFITMQNICRLCNQAVEVFMSEPCLLELQAPIKICGDMWGQYSDLLRIFEHAGFPPKSKYLFLGNYTYDKTYGFETICLLLAYKIKYPDSIFLLRGEYDEEARIKSLGDLYCTFYTTVGRLNLGTLANCFNCMPVAAIIDKKIFFVHGGLSPQLHNLEEIKRIKRPAAMQAGSLLHDLIIAEPDSAIPHWGKRADGRITFGPDEVYRFLKKHDLLLFCRGHHAAEYGHEFFADKQLVSIVSTPNPNFRFVGDLLSRQKNYDEYSNCAGVVIEINDTFKLSFLFLQPGEKKFTFDLQQALRNSLLPIQKDTTASSDTWGTRVVKRIQGLLKESATETSHSFKIGRRKELEVAVVDELEATKLENLAAVATKPDSVSAPKTSEPENVARYSNDSSQIVDYGILQKERDDALKEAEALRLKIQQLTASTSESSSANISYKELQQATKNFDISTKIGEGGFAIVYKGFLRGTNVAVKTLRPERPIEQSGFDKEAMVLSKVRHPNLVTLIGFCSQPFALVYEYLSKGSLEDCLVYKDGSPPLSWQVRTRIISEIRSALIFLHSNKPHPIVHGDLKPDNIFLDANMVSKLGDFGICSFLDSSSTHSFYSFTDNPRGTLGYIDPEYLMAGRLTTQSDVYSFGVIILRLISGRPVRGIIEEARMAISKQTLLSMIDPTAGNWPAAQAKELIKLGLKCCNIDRKKRPKLDGKTWKTVEATILNSLKSK